MRKTVIADQKERKHIGHTEFCNDPKCRGNCKKEDGEPLGNLLLYLGKIYKVKPEISVTQDKCKVYEYNGSSISKLPKLFVIVDVKNKDKQFLYSRIKDKTIFSIEELKKIIK